MPRVVVINGSLRRASINRKLALALSKLAPSKLDLTMLRIDDLPLFNQDMENDPPAPVMRIKSEITEADALLFLTPEHNRSVSAAMKNVIDWCTRPYGTTVWPGKPAAIAGASPGSVGTAVAQEHLRSVLTSLGVALMGRPEAYIVFKEGLIDDDGTVIDESVRKFLAGYVDAFGAWIERVALS